MTDLFEAIAKRIKDELPTGDNIKTVATWNNQRQKELERKTKAIRYNAIFMEFIVEESRSIGLGVKDKIVVVRFHFAIKSLKSDKRENLSFAERFAGVFEGWASDGVSLPVFSSFREVQVDFDEDHSNVAFPTLDYRIIYRDVSGYFFTGTKSVPNANLVISPPISVETEL